MFKISYIDQVTIKVIFFTLLSLFAIPYYFYAGGTLLGFVIIRVIGTYLNGIATIGSHRWLCHNSFEPSTFGRRLILFSMVLSGYGRPLHLVVAHRLHHANTDTELDPHSPKNLSVLSMWLGRYTITSGVRVPKDFFRKSDAVFVNNHYWKLYILFNVLLALIDLKTALIFCPVSFILSWTSANIFVNYMTHVNGELRNLNNFLSWFTHGEGLHKNHHENPASYDFSGNGQKDPALPIIKNILMKK
jgi:stearoyl-CoA desaturase (delta-9 desaturase)